MDPEDHTPQETARAAFMPLDRSLSLSTSQSVLTPEDLPFPVRGRGWTRLSALRNPVQTFEPANLTSESITLQISGRGLRRNEAYRSRIPVPVDIPPLDLVDIPSLAREPEEPQSKFLLTELFKEEEPRPLSEERLAYLRDMLFSTMISGSGEASYQEKFKEFLRTHKHIPAGVDKKDQGMAGPSKEKKD